MAKKRSLKSKPNKVDHRCSVALLIIDMLNTFDFSGGKQLEKHARKAAKNIYKLKARLKEKSIPIIYLNDNFGRWRSDHKEVYDYCTQENCLGKEIAQILRPEEDDFFVLKPRHSGFFSTNLDVLLKDLGVTRMILTGVAGNICVLFTANDAHMRDYKIWVPNDCIASNTKRDNDFALQQMRDVLKIPTAGFLKGPPDFFKTKK